MNKTLLLSLLLIGFLTGAVVAEYKIKPERTVPQASPPLRLAQQMPPSAASSQVIAISSTPSVTNVQRLGVNIGQWAFYQAAAGEFQNLMMNPGFEQSGSGRVVVVPSSGLTSSMFCDNVSWFPYPSGFYNGATFQDVYTTGSGATATAATRGTGTITAYTPTGCSNSTPQFTYNAGFTVQAGDYIMLHATGNINPQLQNPGYPPAGWWNNDPQWTLVADNEPNSDGKQALDLPLNGSSHSINQYSDSTSNYTNPDGSSQNFILITGPWTVSLWAKCVSCSADASININFGRFGAASFVNQTFTPTSSWAQYTFTFTGNETSLTNNVNGLQFNIVGSGTSGHIRFDDVFVGPSSASAAPWSNSFISVLQSLHPGVIRAWQGDEGDSYVNMVADDAARGTTAGGAGAVGSAAWMYSLDGFLKLASTVGAVPWVNVPMSLTDSELSLLGNYFAVEQAKYNFSSILLEFADEQWNGGSCGGACTSSSGDIYTAIDGRAFSMIKNAAGSTVPLKAVAEGQYGAYPPGGNISTVAPTAKAQGMSYVDMAPYYWYCDNAGKSTTTLLADFLGDQNIQLPDIQTVFTSLNGLPAVAYEAGPSSWWGTMSNAQRNGIMAGAASATADAELALNWWSAGGVLLSNFDLSQTDFSQSVQWSAPGLCSTSDAPPSGFNAYMWGLVHDYYTPLLRPRGLAMQLLNTYFMPTSTGSFYPAATSIPGVTAGAWNDPAHGFGWSVAAVNTTSEVQSFVISLPASAELPTGTLWQINNHGSVTDQNETCIKTKPRPGIKCLAPVRIGPGEAIQAGPESNEITISIPPYGLVVARPSQAGG